MTDFAQHASTSEVAVGVSLRLGTRDWSVFLVPEARGCEGVARTLAAEIELVGEVKVRLVTLTDALLEQLLAEESSVVVCYELTENLDSLWSLLDRERSRLPLHRSVVLVLSPSTYVQLEHVAPNLASWLGASVSVLGSGANVLTGEEREARLEALRERFALTDDALLEKVRNGEAPADPWVAEWLVLLGLGGLLAQR